MDPEDLQGVLRTIGQQSNAIQFFQDQLAMKNNEIELLKESLKKYEPTDEGGLKRDGSEAVDSGEMVHFNNGKDDFSLSASQDGVAR